MQKRSLNRRRYYGAFLYLSIIGSIISLNACTVSKVKHNKSVTQEVISRSNDTVVVRAGSLYEAGKVKRIILGDHYRDVWLAPVEVPVLNLDSAKGGLKILERGGGMQTFTLKLQGGNGRLYSLRSLQKDPSQLLPLALQYSFADDVVQDQISASHPYAAFILPVLGDAAGIYHTNPELVYLPDTPTLGEYRDDFGGMLAMLEQDADEDWSGYEDFGNTKNAVSTETLLDKLTDDHDHQIDAENFLRNRLFDIWIGDLDRHEGQYRWAELEKEDGNLYRPIPEDRDNVFFKFDGVLPSLINRKWGLRKFQDFQPDIRDMAGLNYSALYMDKRFLSGLSKSDWAYMAEDLQRRLTDDVIEIAMTHLPDTVYRLTGSELIRTLKIRRVRLKDFALEYYAILAQQVDVVGSNESEYFETIRKAEGNTVVNVYSASDEGGKDRQLFSRTFSKEETDELRLYGLGGEDFFYVSGEADDGHLLRIIGGEDEDTFADSSDVKGLKRKTIYYDNEKENSIEEGPEAKVKLSTDADNNFYNYEEYAYNFLGPAGYFGLNSDDGFFIGGGIIIKTHGFRKKPYGSYQRIVANFSPATAAWNFDYEGDFLKLVGEAGLNVELTVRAPNYFTNFYGFGNETIASNDDEYFYRVRFEQAQLFVGLTLGSGQKANVKFGPVYHYAQVRNNEGKYIDLVPPGLVGNFGARHFAGFQFDATVRTTEQEMKPEKGIKWLSEILWLGEMEDDPGRMGRLKSELSLYYTVDIPVETTFAVRIGGTSISGDFTFYQASTIGGNAGLSRHGTVRGYGRDRFAGRSSIYQNNEIRMRLLKVPFYYLPFEMGISAHFDQGRVWIDEESSKEWHTGRGGGLWIAPLGRWVFTAVYTKGEEDGMYNVNLGFLF